MVTTTNAEWALLRDCLDFPEAFDQAIGQGVVKEDFEDAGGLVFHAMEGLRKKGIALSDSTVRLSTPGEAFSQALTVIAGYPQPTTCQAADYATLIKINSAKRQITSLSKQLGTTLVSGKDTMEHDVQALHSKMEPLIRVLNAHKHQSEMDAALERIMGRLTGEIADDTVFKTGMGRVNKLFQGGLRRTEFVVVAGRTSQGKTAMAVSMLHHLAITDGVPCVMYSYEMSPEQILQRFLSIESGIALSRIREGHQPGQPLRPQHLARLVDAHGKVGTRFKQGTLDIVSAAGWTIDEIAADVMARVQNQKIGVVCVDYLQLVSPPPHLLTANKTTQVSHTTAEAKKLAQRSDTCLLGLSQLNRGVEYRTGEPMLADLRDSGSIEQDANQVLFVFDANPKESHLMAVCPQDYAVKVLDLQKNRNGEIGRIEIFYYGTCTQFVDSVKGYEEEAEQNGMPVVG